MPPRYEEELRPHVRRHFEDRGFAVRDEVPFNGRVADLVAVRALDRDRTPDRGAGGSDGPDGTDGPDGPPALDVVAVELKLADWKRAHVQAKAYQVGARRAYVALPLPKARAVADAHRRARRFEQSGVGLLGVEPAARVAFGAVRHLIEANPSDRTLPFLAEGLATGRVGRRRPRWARR